VRSDIISEIERQIFKLENHREELLREQIEISGMLEESLDALSFLRDLKVRAEDLAEADEEGQR
jgi:hypothetical protein